MVKHPNQIFETPPLRWYYGRPLTPVDNQFIDIDTFRNTSPITKKHDLSTVCSNKQMSHTMHAQRYEFTMEIKRRLGDELHLFGRGINPISNKAEAMDDFKYHIAIENHIEPHHWTEKIADSFLAYCLPFYYGPPNIGDHFPEDSIIPIDIFDIDAAENTIRKAIETDQYSKRLPSIIRAREMVLTQYNPMNVIARIVSQRHEVYGPSVDENIYGRHIFRKKHPIKGLQDAIFRTRMSRHPAASPLQMDSKISA